jgi:hypothetical protein
MDLVRKEQAPEFDLRVARLERGRAHLDWGRGRSVLALSYYEHDAVVSLLVGGQCFTR